jgi:hypothetical protein
MPKSRRFYSNLMIIFLSLTGIIGCTAKQTTTCSDAQSADCPTSSYFGGGASASEVKLTSIKPLVAKPGDEVTVTGVNLNDQTILRLGDQVITWSTYSGDTAKFTMPATPRPGAFAVKVGRPNDPTGAVSPAAKYMISDSADDEYPIYMASVDEICSPKAFRDAEGQLQIGTKDCQNTGATFNPCSADGGGNCVVDGIVFKAAAVANLDPLNIKSGVTIAGQSGSVTPAPANCSSSGQQSCVAQGAYFAGTACAANSSACYLPTYVASAQPLKAINYDAISSSATSIRVGTSLGGVTGTLDDCSVDGATGCVTTSSFKAADMTSVTAGSIKSGVTIAGQLGDYPSASNPLAGATGTADLEQGNFDAQIKSATAFEYWTSAGVHQTGSGDTDITAGNIKYSVSIFGTAGTYTGSGVAVDAWDLRAGVTVGAVTGKLKVNCRNRVRSDVYNYDGSAASIPGSGVTTGAAIDYWDTIDDYNNGLSGLPTSVVSGWTNNDCGGVEASEGDNNVWKDITTTSLGAASNCTTDNARCTKQDKITGLSWSKIQGTFRSWPQAINDCDGLTHNGQSDWRLPTQKELMDAYNHGIRSAASTNWITEADMASNYFCSSSSVSNNTYNAWYVQLFNGSVANDYKTGSYGVVCVR